MWDARDGTVVRDLLTNIQGVWQVVFDERYCVAASNLEGHTYLDVWDFGVEGEADVEAARIITDEDESDSEDEYDSYGPRNSRRYRRLTASASMTSGLVANSRYGTRSGEVIHEDEYEDQSQYMGEEDDEDFMMADATSASASTLHHTHADITPSASDQDVGSGPLSQQAGQSNASWSQWHSSSMSPSPFGQASGSGASSQRFSFSGDGSQFFGSSSSHPEGVSTPSAPSTAAGIAATRRSSRAMSASAVEPKGKSRAFSTPGAGPAGLSMTSNVGLGLGLGLHGMGSPLNSNNHDSTPPTSTVGNIPPSMHAPWVASTYTIQGAHKESEESPSKRASRRHPK